MFCGGPFDFNGKFRDIEARVSEGFKRMFVKREKKMLCGPRNVDKLW